MAQHVTLSDKSKRKPATRLSALAGIWKDAPEMDKIYKTILNERHKSMPRKVRL